MEGPEVFQIMLKKYITSSEKSCLLFQCVSVDLVFADNVFIVPVSVQLLSERTGQIGFPYLSVHSWAVSPEGSGDTHRCGCLPAIGVIFDPSHSNRLA